MNLKIGSVVRLVCVDLFGLCGREPERHPSRADEGTYVGVIVACLEQHEEADPDESFAIYRVCNADGRVLDLATYEVDLHPFDPAGCDVCGGDGCPDCRLVERFTEHDSDLTAAMTKVTKTEP